MIWSSPDSSSLDQHTCTRRSCNPAPILAHAPTSRSCRLFHWSASGRVSSSQYHWTMLASTRAVGVSALYSSSFGGHEPS